MLQASIPLARTYKEGMRQVHRGIASSLENCLQIDALQDSEETILGFYIKSLIGDEFFEAQAYPEAERYQREASQWSDTKNGMDSATSARRLAHWVQTLYFLDAYREAMPLAERSVALSQRLYGIDSLETAEPESLLALIYSYSDRDEDAVPIAHHALSTWIRHLGLSDEDTIEQIRRYAEVGRNLPLGPERGAEIANIALALSETFIGASSVRTETILNDLDWYLRKQGDCETARRYAEASLEMTLRTEGEETSEAANRFHSLGTDEYCAGDIALAIQHTERALDISRKIFGENHSRVAYLAAELADWSDQAGQIQKSKDYAQRAVRILNDSMGDTHPNAPDVFDFVGTAALQWDVEWSKSLSKRYLSVMQGLYGDEDIALVDPLINLANAELIDGELSLGLQHARRAVELTLGYADSRHTLPDEEALDTLVLAETELHQRQAAEQHALMALHYAQLQTHLKHPYTSHAYQQLATTLYPRRPDLAITLLKRAIHLEIDALSRITATPEAERRQRESMIKPHCERLSQWLMQTGRRMERDALVSEGNFDCDPSPPFTPAETDWLDRYDEMARKAITLDRPLRRLLRQGEHGSINDKETLLTQSLRHRSSEHTENLKHLFHQPLTRKPKENTSLKANEIKSIQFRLQHEAKRTAWLHYALKDGTLSLTVITPDAVHGITIPQNGVSLFHQIHAQDQTIGHFRALYDTLIAPIRSILDQAEIVNLLIDAKGPVSSVPFAALHDGNHFLATHYRMAFLSGRHPAVPPVGALKSMALFGTREALNGFRALPEVANELNHLSLLARQKGLRYSVNQDQEFTGESVREAIRQKTDLLHFATHFIPSPGRGTASSLLLGNGTPFSTKELLQLLKNSPLPRLITLSVCDSGTLQNESGSDTKDEGLMQQLSDAGVPIVIGTLRPVTDHASSNFMTAFYAHLLLESASPDEALQKTQEELRLNQPPGDWASFVLLKR